MSCIKQVLNWLRRNISAERDPKVRGAFIEAYRAAQAIQGQVTYLLNDGGSITCLICGLTSHHPEDVRQRYCGRCHCFHDDRAMRDEAERAATHPGP